jgi:L-fuconolactonase
MAVIDAHQHFWELHRFNYAWLDAPQLAPIRRSFLPADLAPSLRQVGVERSIFVQTQHNLAEARWVLRLAEQYDFIAGVVGWIDLASPDCERQLIEFRQHPKFVGARHVTQDEPDPDFIIRPDVLQGLAVFEQRDVPFDLLFYVQHLRHAATLAERMPRLRLVIDHLAKPRVKTGEMSGWIDDLRAAARHPNVYCKLSGLVTEADWKGWKLDDLRPYVREALDCFGPGRLMFGSDWPVCLLAASDERVYAAIDAATQDLSGEERAQIFGETATQFYRLPQRAV